jgi:mannose-6-phosphate isomerase-like protein (cupin superfamily)
MKVSIQEFSKQLPMPSTSTWPQGVWDIEAFAHGSMSLVLFAPKQKDYQTHHDQDELYVVVKGSGTFIQDDATVNFSVGDALFVAAGVNHHFENFTEDLTLWAIFWGPKGGE